MSKKVVVGMSGGVDSSVAAMLLKQQGYDVVGVTMQIWQDEAEEVQQENGGCCGLSAVDDARRVAETIGIPYYVMNFKDDFRKNVMDYFADSYLNGQTPNPCIACNRYVKWEALLERSLQIGAVILQPSLCKDRKAAKWALCDPQFCDSGKRPDLCSL